MEEVRCGSLCFKAKTGGPGGQAGCQGCYLIGEVAAAPIYIPGWHVGSSRSDLGWSEAAIERRA